MESSTVFSNMSESVEATFEKIKQNVEKENKHDGSSSVTLIVSVALGGVAALAVVSILATMLALKIKSKYRGRSTDDASQGDSIVMETTSIPRMGVRRTVGQTDFFSIQEDDD